jgi:multisubunit Na+/H+ antiporter MnhC subunit
MLSSFIFGHTQLTVIALILLIVTGIYCIVVTPNLIRTLLGVELISKGITLLIILAGALTGRMAQAQSFAITFIIIEVAVIAIAAGVVVGIFKKTGSADAAGIRTMKG